MNVLVTPDLVASDWLAAMMPVIEAAPADVQLSLAQEAAECGYALGQLLVDGGFLHPAIPVKSQNH